ncbi:hypothetical protein CBM2599_A90151 [Cupriavidus taiwanensis]|nr:hypothetical protein CBM2600_A100153 [Cupriavidus taiwanensis]SOY92269.1 hypothetical protein CBM2599_A90151 [Cupriavidus taiwanensis]
MLNFPAGPYTFSSFRCDETGGRMTIRQH